MKILLAHNNFAVTGGAEAFYHMEGPSFNRFVLLTNLKPLALPGNTY